MLHGRESLSGQWPVDGSTEEVPHRPGLPVAERAVLSPCEVESLPVDIREEGGDRSDLRTVGDQLGVEGRDLSGDVPEHDAVRAHLDVLHPLLSQQVPGHGDRTLALAHTDHAGLDGKAGVRAGR